MHNPHGGCCKCRMFEYFKYFPISSIFSTWNSYIQTLSFSLKIFKKNLVKQLWSSDSRFGDFSSILFHFRAMNLRPSRGLAHCPELSAGDLPGEFLLVGEEIVSRSGREADHLSCLYWWVPSPLRGADHLSCLYWWVPSPLRDNGPNLMMSQYPYFRSLPDSPLRWWFHPHLEMTDPIWWWVNIPTSCPCRVPLSADGFHPHSEMTDPIWCWVLPHWEPAKITARWWDYPTRKWLWNQLCRWDFPHLESKVYRYRWWITPTRKKYCRLIYTPFPMNHTRDRYQHCNAPVRRVRRRYCDVYTQVRNTLTYIH